MCVCACAVITPRLYDMGRDKTEFLLTALPAKVASHENSIS